MRVLVALVAMCAVARAQQMPCEPCQRGDALLAKLPDEGVAVRAARNDMMGLQAGLRGGSEITAVQDAAMQRLLNANPALHQDVDRLSSASEQDLSDIAAAICDAPNNDCVQFIVPALHCMTGRCHVVQEEIQDHVVRPPDTCDPTVKTVSSPKRG